MKTKRWIVCLLALLAVVALSAFAACETQHEHTAAETWSSDATNHWHECTAEDGAKLDEAPHTFGDLQVVTPATEESTGTGKRVCTVCGYEKTEVIEKLQHQHVAAETWSHDATNHWHECVKDDGAKLDEAPHAFGDLQVTTPATCTSVGSGTKTCSVCGYEKTEEIPKALHEIDELTVNTPPDKTAYDALETFDTAGLVLKSVCKNCHTEFEVDLADVTIGYQTANAAEFHVGDVKVTLTYNNISTDVTVTVAALANSVEITLKSGLTIHCGDGLHAGDVIATATHGTAVLTYGVNTENAVPTEFYSLEDLPDDFTFAAKGHYYFAKATVAAEGDYEGAAATEALAVEHAFGEWTVTTPATYDEFGEETRTCSCGETETRQIAKLIHVESISATVNGETSVTVEKGKSVAVSVTVLPENATNKNYNWTTTDENVATCIDGQIYGFGVGQATLTATTEDGSLTATISVTVIVHPTGVTLNTTSSTLAVGQTLQLTATVAPSDATDKTVTYASSDPDVATVSEDGLVMAVSFGNATITVTTTDGGKTATCALSVIEMAIDGVLDTGGGYSQVVYNTKTTNTTNKISTVTHTAFGQGGLYVFIEVTDGDVRASGDYASHNETFIITGSAAEIGKSIAFRVYPLTGQVRKYVHVTPGSNNYGWGNGEYDLYGASQLVKDAEDNVIGYTVEAYIPYASLQLDGKPADIKILTAIGYWANSSATTLSFYENNDSVGNTAQYDVTRFTLYNANGYVQNVTATPAALDIDRDDLTDGNYEKTFTLKCDDNNVVTGATFSGTGSEYITEVGNGVYKFAASESAMDEANPFETAQTVTVSGFNGADVTLSITLDTTHNVKGVSLASATGHVIEQGGTLQLTATVAPADADNKNVSFTSSDPSVATVDDTGLVTYVGNGMATITVTTEQFGLTATYLVRCGNASDVSYNKGEASAKTTTYFGQEGLYVFIDVTDSNIDANSHTETFLHFAQTAAPATTFSFRAYPQDGSFQLYNFVVPANTGSDHAGVNSAWWLKENANLAATVSTDLTTDGYGVVIYIGYSVAGLPEAPSTVRILNALRTATNLYYDYNTAGSNCLPWEVSMSRMYDVNGHVTAFDADADMLAHLDFTGGTVSNSVEGSSITAAAKYKNKQGGGSTAFVDATPTFVTGIDGDANGAILSNNEYGAYAVLSGMQWGTSEWTVSAWIKFPKGYVFSTGNGSYLYGTTKVDTTTGGFRWTIRNTSSPYSIQARADGNTGNSPSAWPYTIALSVDTWYNFTVVRCGGEVCFYVNGEYYTRQTCSSFYADFGSNDLAFGGYFGETWTYNNGSMIYDDIRIYSKALNLSQIEILARMYDVQAGDVVMTYDDISDSVYEKTFTLINARTGAAVTGAAFTGTGSQYVTEIGDGVYKVSLPTSAAENFATAQTVTVTAGGVAARFLLSVYTSDSPLSIVISGIGSSYIEVNGTANLTATIVPGNAADKTVTWSSSDETVATVNATTGEVTGVSSGTVVITATAANGVTASISLYVIVKPTATVHIDFDDDTDYLKNDGTLTTAEIKVQTITSSSTTDETATFNDVTSSLSASNFVTDRFGTGNAIATKTSKDGMHTTVEYNFGTGDFTISVWLKFDINASSLSTGTSDYLFGTGRIDGKEGAFRTNLKNSQFGSRLGTMGGQISTNPFTLTGQWIKYTMVREGTSVKFYVSTQSCTYLIREDTIAANYDFSANLLSFGGYINSYYGTTTFYFDDITIYDSALSANQVMALAANNE